jgi:hypothetical protein
MGHNLVEIITIAFGTDGPLPSEYHLTSYAILGGYVWGLKSKEVAHLVHI